MLSLRSIFNTNNVNTGLDNRLYWEQSPIGDGISITNHYNEYIKHIIKWSDRPIGGIYIELLTQRLQRSIKDEEYS